MFNLNFTIMKNVIALMMLSGLLLSFPFEAVAQDDSKILGEWSFNTPDAGYGYEKGTINISKTEDGLKGEVKFSDGYKVEMKDVVIEGPKVSFGIMVEYEYIKVTLTLEEGVLKGKAGTSEGSLEVTAKR